MAKYPFVQAKNYHVGRIRNPTRFLGVHCMQALDGPQTAEATAQFFHNQAAGSNGSSAHISVDQNSVVQSVKAGDTAWAIPNANADGFHVEMPGYASWSREEWLKHDLMLNIASCVFAQAVAVLRFLGSPIDVRFLSDSEIANHSGFGFVEHADCTRAFHTPGGHTDPGVNFPRDVLLGKVSWWLPRIHDINFV